MALILVAVPALVLVVKPRELLYRRAIGQHQQDIAVTLHRDVALRSRVALGAPYAPSDSAPAPATAPKLDILIAALEGLAKERPTSEAWNLAGVAHLLRGRIDLAIACFERALEITPSDPAALTNLAVAFNERGLPADRVRAFDVAYGALSTGAPPEAWFNAAVASERVLTKGEIEAAWREAKRHERDPAWLAVIDKRLAAANGAGVDTSAIRTSLEREVLPMWVASCVDGAADERANGARASQLAADLAARTGDRYFSDLVAWMGGSACNADRAALYKNFLSARQLYENDRRDAALHALTSQIPALAALQSPATPLAQSYLATCLYFTPRQARALPLLQDVVVHAQRSGYHDVLGRAESMRGFIAADRNALDEAMAAYRAAGVAYDAAGNVEGAISARALVGLVTDTLGDYRLGWVEREAAFARLRSTAVGRWAHGTLGMMSRAAARDGLRVAAYQFAQICLDVARRDNAPIRLAEAAVDYARVAYPIGRREDAERALAEAEQVAARIDSEGARARTQAAIAMVQARFGSGPRVRERLTAGLDAYSSVGSEVLRGELLLRRGRVYLAEGDVAAAERDFTLGIDVFEQARSQLSSTAMRLSYFEEAWQLFDELAALKVRQRDYDAALDVLERGRGRALRDAMRTNLSPAALARTVPDDAAVLLYAAFERDLVVWTIRSGRVQAIKVPVARSELQSLALATRADVRSDGQAVRRLYDLLITPVEASLAGARRVYIVPDPVLHYVPFAALRRNDDFLVDRYTLVMLPGISGAHVGSASSPPDGARRALVVGAENGGLRERLPRLIGAASEARDIAALYPEAHLLSSDGLRKSEVLSLARQYPVLHFAGHAVVNAEAPQFSRLLLSSDVAEGVLYAHDLERADLRGLKVVVLAACETAAGRTYRSEGVVSLARSLVAQGAESVIASLWPIDDARAGSAFLDIHRRMRAGRRPEDAVADVQRKLFRTGDAELVRGVVVVSRTVR